jgi:murein DD-endopeptidase MepM/ murein hydrolase activator NlpD
MKLKAGNLSLRTYIMILLFVWISTAITAYCEEVSKADKSDNKNGASCAESPVKKARSGKKRKKPNLNDPEKLKEIAEKSILAIQSGDEGSSLEIPVEGRVTSTVGIRPDPINGDVRMHNGIDIAIAEGTPVRPVAPGRVAYSGLQPGYGYMVIVQHDDGMITIYAHHSRNLVKTGDKVVKETILALSGSTGHSTGPHLHFEAWQGGVNVTSAFLSSFAGSKIEESRHGSLERTNLRKVIMSDGTILFVEVVRKKGSR